MFGNVLFDEVLNIGCFDFDEVVNVLGWFVLFDYDYMYCDDFDCYDDYYVYVYGEVDEFGIGNFVYCVCWLFYLV